ncbi:MAG: isoprenylcysteine carboxylmethyltransferase family protein [Vicinamibacterales bacterium]|nr:isoprenylcysteine carboxylmethyltransferase family protein [Vicinamibacterales bacterium]
MRGILATLARWRVRLGAVTVVVALLLARPTWTSWGIGLAIALTGEGIRIWAAGHLEKSREVTRSGPYRWMAHPLYVGSSVLALGVVVAAGSPTLAVLAALYMGATITAAIRTEEANLRQAFGSTYDDYRAARAQPMERRFSLDRAIRNREYRAATGVVLGFALLALRLYVLL